MIAECSLLLFSAESLQKYGLNCGYTEGMLLRFRFSNFQSFRAEQEFSLIAGFGPDATEDPVSLTALKDKALRTAAIYGPNASGKTTVLRALQFMARMVTDSHRLWKPESPVPVRPFRAEANERPSGFEADFLLNGVRHQYAFSVDAAGVVQESLSVYPNGKRQQWFNRERGKPISFGRNLPGDRNRTIAGLTRRNSLFVSAAAQNAHDALLPVYRWFENGLSFVLDDRMGLTRDTARLCMNEQDRSAVAELVAVADMGIIDVRAEEPPPAEPIEPAPSLQLFHSIAGSTVEFELKEESNGTIAYLGLLGPIVRILRNGGVLLVDELDRSLHPSMVRSVLALFRSEKTNPRRAQLIFNTHDTSMLSGHLLRRDQVWFTEKDRSGESHLYPLTHFKPRKQENLGSGYMQGRYGAVPILRSLDSAVDPGVDEEGR